MIEALVVAACVLMPGTAPLQTKQAKPKPKPAPAKPTAGAVQMPGDNGKVGVPYRLGSKGSELHFTLEKVAFASRYFSKEETLYPSPEQRLLLVTFAVQNPHSFDTHFFEQSFNLTVVSPDDQNFVSSSRAAHPERGDTLNMMLKPAQKIRAVMAIPIHRSGPVNKLIVQKGQGTPVLRYDLRSKVSPMTGAFAALQGQEMANKGAATLGAPFGIGPFDITVEKLEESASALGSYDPDGGKLVIATVTVKNVSMHSQALHYSILQPLMVDEDGSDFKWTYGLIKMSAPDALNATIEPGSQVRARLVFVGPSAAKPATLAITEQTSSQTVVVSLAAAG